MGQEDHFGGSEGPAGALAAEEGRRRHARPRDAERDRHHHPAPAAGPVAAAAAAAACVQNATTAKNKALLGEEERAELSTGGGVGYNV